MRNRIVLAAFLLFSFTPIPVIAATWVPFAGDYPEGTPPIITTLESDSEHTVIDVVIPGMWVENITAPDGIVYQQLEIPGCDNTFNEGLPSVPVIAKYVAIPATSGVSLNILEQTESTLTGYNVFPAQRSYALDEEWVFCKDDAFLWVYRNVARGYVIR